MYTCPDCGYQMPHYTPGFCPACIFTTDEDSYEEPNCLMCDDSGVIEDPESGKTYVCQYCDAYNSMVHDDTVKEQL